MLNVYKLIFFFSLSHHEDFLIIFRSIHLSFNFSPGFGCDTSAVVNILAHRDSTQRALIQQEYRIMYHEELLKRLASELTGKLEV